MQAPYILKEEKNLVGKKKEMKEDPLSLLGFMYPGSK
jgi:hypothetical protein